MSDLEEELESLRFLGTVLVPRKIWISGATERDRIAEVVLPELRQGRVHKHPIKFIDRQVSRKWKCEEYCILKERNDQVEQVDHNSEGKISPADKDQIRKVITIAKYRGHEFKAVGNNFIESRRYILQRIVDRTTFEVHEGAVYRMRRGITTKKNRKVITDLEAITATFDRDNAKLYKKTETNFKAYIIDPPNNEQSNDLTLLTAQFGEMKRDLKYVEVATKYSWGSTSLVTKYDKLSDFVRPSNTLDYSAPEISQATDYMMKGYSLFDENMNPIKVKPRAMTRENLLAVEINDKAGAGVHFKVLGKKGDAKNAGVEHVMRIREVIEKQFDDGVPLTLDGMPGIWYQVNFREFFEEVGVKVKDRIVQAETISSFLVMKNALQDVFAAQKERDDPNKVGIKLWAGEITGLLNQMIGEVDIVLGEDGKLCYEIRGARVQVVDYSSYDSTGHAEIERLWAIYCMNCIDLELLDVKERYIWLTLYFWGARGFIQTMLALHTGEGLVIDGTIPSGYGTSNVGSFQHIFMRVAFYYKCINEADDELKEKLLQHEPIIAVYSDDSLVRVPDAIHEVYNIDTYTEYAVKTFLVRLKGVGEDTYETKTPELVTFLKRAAEWSDEHGYFIPVRDVVDYIKKVYYKEKTDNTMDYHITRLYGLIFDTGFTNNEAVEYLSYCIGGMQKLGAEIDITKADLKKFKQHCSDANEDFLTFASQIHDTEFAAKVRERVTTIGEKKLKKSYTPGEYYRMVYHD